MRINELADVCCILGYYSAAAIIAPLGWLSAVKPFCHSSFPRTHDKKRLSVPPLRSCTLTTNQNQRHHLLHCTLCSVRNDRLCFLMQVLKKDLGDQAEQVGKKIDWLTFKSLEGSVRDDLQIIKQSPLIPSNITVYGFIYDVSAAWARGRQAVHYHQKLSFKSCHTRELGLQRNSIVAHEEAGSLMSRPKYLIIWADMASCECCISFGFVSKDSQAATLYLSGYQAAKLCLS